MTNEHIGGRGPGGGCGPFLELLSLEPSGALAPEKAERLGRHLKVCDACADEAAFVARVFRARPHAPPELAEALIREILHDRAPRTVPSGWLSASLAAAAVLVVSLGIGVATQFVGPGEPAPAWVVAFEASDEAWAAEEWVVAGAPVLDGVSDESLLRLLAELES